MKIVFLHHNRTKNIGDLSSCPASYLDFPVHEIADPLAFEGTADLAIIGGGGLMSPYFDEQISKIVKNVGALVLWGVGTHYSQFGMAPWAEKADMIGIRDEGCGYELVPCASCLSPLFDEIKAPTFEKVGYYHYHLGWRPQYHLAQMHNHSSNLKNTLQFLASGKRVLTNSYHGAYWGKLLKREVILSENWNSKFNHIPTDDLHMARTRNLVFYKDVVNRFNLFG